MLATHDVTRPWSKGRLIMTNNSKLRRLGVIATLVAASLLAGRASATPSLVIDVATGQVLEQDQATASWYPASVTKLMTTYVALGAVRAGRITMDTPLVMSPRACRMAPSKMGFRAGSEVTLRNALIMLMVKSANDIAVAIAEGVSGSVEAFADEMNQASEALGMTQSQWVNPNGLPDSRQVTSARDLAILGRALYLQYPESAGLFNIGSMQFGGHIEPNHNGLIGRYPGADGMKTGFTCPAGFNVVASATRNGQHLLAVILGAPSATARTAKAAALFDRAFAAPTPIGTLASIPSAGPTAAPDMRDRVCRNRGAATAEFMAEVDGIAAPPSTGIPLLDTLGGGSPLPPREVALLPRPQFQPVRVYLGRAPGYVGPVARARPAGAPIGAGGEATAYANESAAPDADASPISQPAADATPLRHVGKRGKRHAAAAPADDIAQEPAEAPAKARGKSADKKSGKKAEKVAAKASKPAPAKPDAKSAAKPAKPKAGKAK